MDFNDSPAEAEFRQQARDWLQANVASVLGTDSQHDVEAFTASARLWQRKKAEAGYAAIRWPRAEGGLDGTPMQEVIFQEEESRYAVPVGPLVTIGTQLAIPTLRTHGTAEQIERFTRPTLNGDLIWCQLFSEPSAGSDLANLRTRAVKDGDDWVINGQKVWTSWAHVADWGILLARTDSEATKHKGLTFFLVNMRSVGIDVRPIEQISGESEFNEVFFTDLRIPDSYRIGAVGEGWKCAMTTLMNERVNVGGESQALPSVVELLEQIGKSGSQVTQDRFRIASLLTKELGLRYFRFRLLTSLSKGETPGPIAAMSKLVYANALQELSALALDNLGLEGMTDEQADAPATRFGYGYQWAAALRIAGGTDEILRNQIAERVLGMPGEIRVDKNIPFSQCR
ncbi:acyl-CoA dehydrogenase family protein [Pseudomonas sp. PDM31]|jgi:alkylation response protein AidB-like acyl-CoA dehydrogenase|uniref:acyl-CoA dehydrogenase family protein n=1 Tax=Pseudomonas sp. PDM31 TaxID=2854778 RepID=UPI001C461FA9|nr:acyl-CoA dehydrogenase family protein [Pseudomonas sp. PDM31]MBV7477554.1 acyl-CoA dehydrogenase family protein [Pseudomonas sp. PDM31]